MATLKLYLDKRVLDASKTAPLKIALTHNHKTVMIPLGIRLTPSQWDGHFVVKHPDKIFLNDHISRQVSKLNRKLLSLSDTRNIRTMSAVAVKKALLTDESEANIFSERYISYMETRKAKRTRDIYMATLNRMREYDDLFDSRTFDEIDRVWLKGFDAFMAKRSPSQNARNIHFRNIRAVFNDAIDDEITRSYPFRKFKFKAEATSKRSLSVEELREFLSAPVQTPYTRYQDYFMLMFFLIGINTIDLCRLKSIKNGRIEYRRAKTGRIYSIKAEPEAMEIINRHYGKKRLLDIMDTCSDYLHFANRFNAGLHRIKPELSAYWARHTWATIAAELDIPKETIAAALGHGGNSVTDIYINFDMRKVDEANRRVIDYVLYDKR